MDDIRDDFEEELDDDEAPLAGDPLLLADEDPELGLDDPEDEDPLKHGFQIEGEEEPE